MLHPNARTGMSQISHPYARTRYNTPGTRYNGSGRAAGGWVVRLYGEVALSDAHILLLGAIVIQARLDARRDPEAAEWLEGLRHRRYGVPVSCNPAQARGVKRTARH